MRVSDVLRRARRHGYATPPTPSQNREAEEGYNQSHASFSSHRAACLATLVGAVPP